MIELRDHLVDALRHVLSPLIRFEQLPFEGTNATRLLFDLAPQARTLLALPPVRLGERGNRPLESLEIVGVSLVRNEGPPRQRGIVPASEEFSQAATVISSES